MQSSGDAIPFKMFGLQRTGTNLMVALLTRNFHVHSVEEGTEWKHGPVEHINRQWNGRDVRFVLCVKNPYAWLPSCYRYFRRAAGSDDTVPAVFRRNPPISFETFVISPSFGSASPLQRWAEMNRRWLAELPPSRTALVRHEDQLTGQVQVLERVERELGLTRRQTALQPIDQRVGVLATLKGPMNQGYYLERQYLSVYTPALLERVNQTLDADLMDRLGYDWEHQLPKKRQVQVNRVPSGPARRAWGTHDGLRQSRMSIGVRSRGSPVYER